VLETKNYAMPQRIWQENQKSLDELQRLAVKDKIMLIKIPKKHTPEELERARAMCTVTMSPAK